MRILIFLCIFLFITTLTLIFIVYKTFSEKNNTDKELKSEYEKAEKTAAIITEAEKTKADARTGDHNADINYMADKLHHYANK